LKKKRKFRESEDAKAFGGCIKKKKKKSYTLAAREMGQKRS